MRELFSEEGEMKNIILWLLLSCLGISEPYVVEDAPSVDDVWIIEDADDPFE